MDFRAVVKAKNSVYRLRGWCVEFLSSRQPLLYGGDYYERTTLTIITGIGPNPGSALEAKEHNRRQLRTRVERSRDGVDSMPDNGANLLRGCRLCKRAKFDVGRRDV